MFPGCSRGFPGCSRGFPGLFPGCFFFKVSMPCMFPQRYANHKKNIFGNQCHFFLAPADWLASRPMALPLLKPAERPVLRAVSMCKMERRWSSCASTGSRRRHWPYSASMDNSLTTEIDTRSRHHPMCQFDPNLSCRDPGGEKDICTQFRISSPGKVQHPSS